MPRAILFDIDGTLVDSNQFHVLAWAEAFHAAGHDLRFSDLHRQIGKGADNFVKALLPRATQAEIAALGEAHARLFRNHYLHRVAPFADANALLARCRDHGLRVMLASSASAGEVEHHLDLLAARNLVDGVTSADDVERTKPCPDLFEVALRRAGVAPAEALVVGDTPWDVEAARAAGIATVAVRSGQFDDDNLAGALAIYDDVAELLARFDDSPLSAG